MVYKIYLCLEYALKTPWCTKQFGDYRKVKCGKCMAARPERITGLSVSIKNRGLCFPHYQLCPQLYVCRAYLWITINHIRRRRIRPFYYLHHDWHLIDLPNDIFDIEIKMFSDLIIYLFYCSAYYIGKFTKRCKDVSPWHIPERRTGMRICLDILPSFTRNGVMFKCDRCYDRIEKDKLLVKDSFCFFHKKTIRNSLTK